ncbi:MAG TPA: L,D-transpeptidase family protein, partial [Rubricoccaceae bacterium]
AALGTDALATDALGTDAHATAHLAVQAFYDARGGAPAWTKPDARAAALALLARADRDGLPVAEALPPALAELADVVSEGAPDSLRARLDARLTAAVLAFGARLGTPQVDALDLYGANAWEPAPALPRDARADARALADDLTRAASPAAALDAFAARHRPSHAGYALLRTALARELALASGPDRTIAADLAPGDSGAAVHALRARLAAEDPATAPGDVYDEALTAAVRTYQRIQGLPPTGRTDAATRDALNRRQADAIPALVLNLERWRWMPDTLGDRHVFVNIPAFELVMRDTRGGHTIDVFTSRVVVGQPSWATPVFSDTMETVVFNPTWTMPRSIQREAYGRLRPDRAVRPPGPGNALGRVKFLFPNRHAVYIHDTPSKWGFSVEHRALSHGCVRIGDPQDFARAVLSRTDRWPAARVDSVFTGPWTTRDVRLTHRIPVHIAYFTATADAAGRVTTYPDVYRRDPRLAEALGLTPAPTVVAMTGPPRRDVTAG